MNADDLRHIHVPEPRGGVGGQWPIAPPDIGAIINRRLLESLDRRMTEAVFGARWHFADPNPFPVVSVYPLGARIDNAILRAQGRARLWRFEARWRLSGAWSHLRHGGCEQ